MRIGIRKRLIISFVLLAVIPIAVIMISLAVIFTRMEGRVGTDPQQDPAKQIEEINNSIVLVIEANYAYIDDYDRFYLGLEPLISEYQLQVQIVDKQDMLLFDSGDRTASMKPASSALVEVLENAGQGSSLSKLFLYSLPITVGGEEEATALVQFNPAVAPFNIFIDAIKGMVISFGAGFISFILLIILLTWDISRTILKPLAELNKATERITKGDLEFNIHYNKKDELGNFARSFESMRLQLNESLAKQKVIENARKEMLASISHDLRTPIASIQGYVEGLRDGVAEDEETRNRYLSVIRDKTGQLNRQIEDLFEYSRLDAGQLELRAEDVDSRDILENILQEVELRHGNKGPALRVVRPLPAVKVQVDPQRLEQVMMNLLENAFRYVPEEGRVTVRSWADDAQLIVAIEDNGPGIAERHLPHIFNSFFRGERSRSRKSGGSGLGLAICKQIIEAHAGKIWVQSKEGEGTTFSFCIPIK